MSSDTDESSYHDDEDPARSASMRGSEQCEFCDTTFNNRNDLLKHNMTHIIIPLLKLETHECSECLFHFTSAKKLKNHIKRKHKIQPNKMKDETVTVSNMPAILKSIVEKEVFIKCEGELNELVKKSEKKSRNKRIQFEEELINSAVKEESMDCFRDDGIEFLDSDSLKGEPIDDPKEVLAKNILLYKLSKDNKEELPTELQIEEIAKGNLTETEGLSIVDVKEELSTEELNHEESIRHRLLFEEDLDDIDDNLFKDLSADCQVSLETLCPELNNAYERLNKTLNLDSIEQDLDFDENVEVSIMEDRFQRAATDLIREGKAIHNDILIEPEVCACKWCGAYFPDRFSLLKHEPTHMVLKSRIWHGTPLCCPCDRYIPGNYRSLRAHMMHNHPQEWERETKYITHKCSKCNLQYYNLKKHLRLHHEFYKCSECNQGFETEAQRKEHKCKYLYQPALMFEDEEIPVDNSDNVIFTSKLPAIMKLCEMCFSFMKIYFQNRQNYEVLGEKSEIGIRFTCDKCHNKFFEVKLVKRTPFTRKQLKAAAKIEPAKDHSQVIKEQPIKQLAIRQSGGTLLVNSVAEITKRVTQTNNVEKRFCQVKPTRTKPLSNRERLEKIRHRLKIIQKRNKM